MSANRIYLVCSHHQSPEDAMLLGERGASDVGYEAAKLKTFDKWLEKHANCGRDKDHFKLAYGRPQNWDVSPPAENTPAGGVRIALMSEGSH